MCHVSATPCPSFLCSPLCECSWRFPFGVDIRASLEESVRASRAWKEFLSSNTNSLLVLWHFSLLMSSSYKSPTSTLFIFKSLSYRQIVISVCIPTWQTLTSWRALHQFLLIKMWSVRLAMSLSGGLQVICGYSYVGRWYHQHSCFQGSRSSYKSSLSSALFVFCHKFPFY